ncbi:Fanconi anemia group J protein homolog isoform X2 [Littorina saxatilis]|uniref:DNA 5'-3' helicase n=1 Tax=Littorina saxatilis TaxID=31220 RepID=A0AAN9AJK1_9CAEN
MASHQEYKIAGHSVLFPCKPYPSQFSMMDKIIKGIQRNQNCLLESPTGSGKSLALLCSALAWQTAEKKKMEEEKQSVCEGNSEVCQCSCHSHKPDATPQHPPTPASATVTTATAATSSASTSTATAASVCEAEKAQCDALKKSVDDDASMVIDDDSDEEFKPLKKFKEPGKTNMATRKKKVRLSIEYEDSPPTSPSLSPSTSTSSAHGVMAQRSDSDSKQSAPSPPNVSPCSHCACEKGAQKEAPRKVPKIFFGTRTHKQVAQIVRELKKTAYHDVPMTILASREHTCIHPQVSNMGNKNEGCENLMKDAGCRFKERVMKYQSQNAIKAMGLHSAWDLEDLVQLMKKKKACPYFLSRGLKDQSDLIICPYNYLVDPLIRESMEINLKGQIVMLDEAHNIEDCVREAASQTITQEQIQKALHDMDVLIEKGVKIADISKLRQMCHKLDTFIEDQSSSLTQHDFQQSYRMWSGFEIIAQLQRLDLGLQKYEELRTTLASIKAEEQEEKLYAGGQDVDMLSSPASSLFEQVFLVLKYLYKDDMKHAEDYRTSIVKSVKYVNASDMNGSWLSSRRNGGRKTAVEVYSLNFWCMNPAVGFADFEACRSVILTSGTLSPMDSFQSELGLPFPILLEANHIIKDSQVWVGAVGEGPNREKLQAVYRNMETFDFQDGLGQLILGVCRKIPKGVLCFLPSYKTLEKLTNRWKATGVWARMEEHKRVMSEPRGSDKMDFEQIIQGFYNTIHSCERNDGENGGVDGALFFAVCRGKVSEGMDFADNFARAVITVGIPYPNFKDLQVELKRKYNDKYQRSRGLLSGHLWYEIQAFRALNQALGRCIRHRKDWGALIIVDDRFVKSTNKYANGLSKWVRQKLRVHHSCTSMLESLSDFTKTRLEAEKLDESMNSSQIPSTPLTPASQTTTTTTALSPPTPLSTTHTTTADSRTPLHDVSNVATPSVSGTPRVTPATVTKDDIHHGKLLFPPRNDSAETAKSDDDVIVTGVSGPGSGGKTEMSSIGTKSGIKDLTPATNPPTLNDQDAVKLVSQASDNALNKVKKLLQTRQGQSLSSSTPVPLLPGSVAQSSMQPASGQTTIPSVHLPVLPGVQVSQGQGLPVLFAPAVSTGTVAGLRPTTQPSIMTAVSKLAQAANMAKAKPLQKKASAPALPDQALALMFGCAGVEQKMVLPTASAGKSASVSSAYPAAVAATGLRSPLSAGNAAQTASTSLSGEPSQMKTTSMMYLPLLDPSMKATLIKLPVASPTQTLLKLDPQFSKAVGVEILTVPAGIRHIVMAKTLEEATNLFERTLRMNDVSPKPGAAKPAMKSLLAGNVSAAQSGNASKPSSAAQSVNATKPSSAAQSLLASKAAAFPQGSSNAVTSARVTAAQQKDTSDAGSNALAKKSATVSPSVQQTKAVGQNNSQASDITTSPSLFGGSPTSQSPAGGTTSSIKPKPSPRSTAFRIPSPSKMRTRAGTNSPASTTARKNGSPTVVSPSPDMSCGANATRKTSDSAQECKRQVEGNLEEGGVKTLMRKRLFRNTPSKGAKPGSSSTNPGQALFSEVTSDGQITNAAGKASEATKARVLFAGVGHEGADTAEAEDEEKVERRVRGSKRRSLSLSESKHKKKRSEDLLDKDTTSSIKCTACGFSLLADIHESDFERRENMPTCLKGMADPSKPEVLYFKGTTVTERFNLPDSAVGDCRKQQSSGGVEASVQLIRCPGCISDDASSSAISLLGAKVTLTDAAAATSTGQMWIFTHMVTLTAEDK